MKGVCWGEWQELVQAQIRMFPSLLNVLERRGLVTRDEGLEEIRRLEEKAGEGAVPHFFFSGHLVRDGYWVDMHLSMMPYTPRDRRTILKQSNFRGAGAAIHLRILPHTALL